METGKVIKVIPKKTGLVVDSETGERVKKRVAAYARVSTDLEDQKNSFEAQQEEYETRIKQNPDWEFVGLYADKGISGTSIKKREGFQNMIADALAGKIDLILIKSISRFARNTVDSIETVRQLRKANVEVYFDKEAISTKDPKVNLMFTMFSSFAEEESHSISENVKWGVRKRMAKGQRKMITKSTIGYLSMPDGTVVVDETERHIVKTIFNLYLIGYSLRQIAEFLTGEGIRTGKGNEVWALEHVRLILSDEKYIGKHVMQKTVVVDFLDHKAYKNDGIEPKYIDENHHEPIISKDIFDITQTLMKKRFQNEKGGKITTNFLIGLIYCEDCLREMKVITNHPGKPYQKLVYTCKKSTKTSSNFRKCTVPKTLNYELVKAAIHAVLLKFTDVANIDKDLFLSAYIDSLTDIQRLINQFKEKNVALEEKLSSVIKNAALATSIEDYKFEYTKINKEIEFNKNQIRVYEDELYKASKVGDTMRGINEFFDHNAITYYLVKDYIGGVIRKRDGSIRIILSDKPAQIDETTIDSLIELKPIYGDSILENDECLIYDVVRLKNDN